MPDCGKLSFRVAWEYVESLSRSYTRRKVLVDRNHYIEENEIKNEEEGYNTKGEDVR